MVRTTGPYGSFLWRIATQAANGALPEDFNPGVITNVLEKAMDLAQRLEVGMVDINDTNVANECRVPFGGSKGAASDAKAWLSHGGDDGT